MPPSFNHPWLPVLVDEDGEPALRFQRGYVEGYLPLIGGKSLAGAAGELPPTLKLKYAVANSKDESWAVLQATPNKDGRIDEKSKLEIVHASAPGGLEGGIARIAIAIILWRNKLPFFVDSICMFNFLYTQVKPTSGPVRHFFR
jgi:hypothetical protein